MIQGTVIVSHYPIRIALVKDGQLSPPVEFWKVRL